MSAAARSLNERVAEVFTGFLIDGIDFRFHPEGLHVNALRLREVGNAIASGRVKVGIAPTGDQLGAAYTPYKYTMTLASEHDLSHGTGRAGILHEGVHVLVQLYECRSTTELSDEAAAYLAQTIYMHAGRISFSADKAAMAIFDAATDLAMARGLYRKKGVRLESKDIEPLRKAIQANTAYASLGWEQMADCRPIP